MGNTFSRSNTYRGLTANINISAFMLTMKSPVIIYFLFKHQKNRLKVWLLSNGSANGCYLYIYIVK